MLDEPIAHSVLEFMKSRPEVLIHSVRSLAAALCLRPPQIILAAHSLVASGQIEAAPSLGASAWRLRHPEGLAEGKTIIVGEVDVVSELGLVDWLRHLDIEAQRRGYPGGGLTSQTGEACWLQFFLDGFSPNEALDADEECPHGS